MPDYGPGEKLQYGCVKVGIDAKGRKHFFLAQYPWHLEKHQYREHSHYWEESPGGKICQQMIVNKLHILPANHDAGDPTDWTEAAMRRWFDQVINEYDSVREGIFFLKNGDMYEGQVNLNNEPHGFGTYTTKHGIKYVGKFENGKLITVNTLAP